MEGWTFVVALLTQLGVLLNAGWPREVLGISQEYCERLLLCGSLSSRDRRRVW